MDELKAQLKAQQKLLERQQAEIQTLESALATQQKMLTAVAHDGAHAPTVVPAVQRRKLRASERCFNEGRKLAV